MKNSFDMTKEDETLFFLSPKGDTIKAIFFSVPRAVGVVGMSYGSLAMAYGFHRGCRLSSILCWRARPNLCFIGIVASGGNPL